MGYPGGRDSITSRRVEVRTYMHALLPPLNVILEPRTYMSAMLAIGALSNSKKLLMNHAQIGVNAWHMGLLDLTRERLEPALGPPDVSIGAPERRVAVDGDKVGRNAGALWDGECGDECTVLQLDGL